MKQAIGFFYFLLGFLHVLDIFNRQIFFGQDFVYLTYLLLIGSVVTAVGFFMERKWGEYLFFFISIGQVLVFSICYDYFSEQAFLVKFHSVFITALTLRFLRNNLLKSKTKT